MKTPCNLSQVEQAYGGQAAYKKARGRGETRLPYEWWLLVRASEFKQTFGDWEVAHATKKLQALCPLNLDGMPPLENKRAIKNAFLKLGEVENSNDSRRVSFPTGMAGKIERHQGFDTKRIVSAFRTLFAQAIPMFSETETPTKNGKDQSSSIRSFHHYVSKFEQAGTQYYVRFTIQQMKDGAHSKGKALAHSTFVSQTSVYENGKGACDLQPASFQDDLTTTEATAPLDRKLAVWLSAGKSKDFSTETDPATGEPKFGVINQFLHAP